MESRARAGGCKQPRGRKLTKRKWGMGRIWVLDVVVCWGREEEEEERVVGAQEDFIVSSRLPSQELETSTSKHNRILGKRAIGNYWRARPGPATNSGFTHFHGLEIETRSGSDHRAILAPCTRCTRSEPSPRFRLLRRCQPEPWEKLGTARNERNERNEEKNPRDEKALDARRDWDLGWLFRLLVHTTRGASQSNRNSLRECICYRATLDTNLPNRQCAALPSPHTIIIINNSHPPTMNRFKQTATPPPALFPHFISRRTWHSLTIDCQVP